MDTEAISRTLSIPDFIVFGLLIAISITIGVFFAWKDKKQNTTENYFLGNRKLKALPVGLSFVVTFQSSIMILGFPAEAYAYGLQYAIQIIGVVFAYLMAAVIVVPIFHPLKVTSVYEYYYLRFKSNTVRYVAVTLGVIHYTLYMGVVMYGTALALESVAGLPKWSSIVIFSTAAIIYTSIGGFNAVIWTDVFQSLVMLVGILAGMDTEAISRTLSIPDFIVFGLLIAISITIGVFFAWKDKKQNTTENYFLGNRKLKALPVGLSFVVTFQSSIMILGFPAEAYAYGLQYAIQIIGVVFAYLMAAIIAVPIFHPLKVTSVYEYYYLRFKSNTVRYVAVTLGVIHYTLYMGVVMYGTALALESVAGLPKWSSIVIFSTAASIYTSIGGFNAVIWTDVFQSLVMLVGILAVLIKSTMDAGGPANVVRLSKGRFNLFDFNPDPTMRHTFWTLVIGAPTQFFFVSISQAGVQRINSTPSISTAKRSLYLSAPIYALTWILVMIQGVAIFAYYSRKGCDPVASGQVSNLNQIIPFTLLELFHDYPGLPGLFIASLSAASLSTMSSGLSSLAAVTYEDIIKVCFSNIKDTTGTNISKGVVAIYGLIAVGFAFLLSNAQGPLGQIITSFMGAIGGPEVGLFLVCVFFRRARPTAVIVATLTGVGFVLWISMGQNFLASVPKAPYLRLGPTDRCPANNKSDSSTILYSERMNNDVTASLIINTTSNPTTESEIPSIHRTGLLSFYSISYMYFNLIGCLTVILVSVVGSLLIQPKEPEPVSDKVVLPFSIFIPSCLKSSNSTIGLESSDLNELEEMINKEDKKHSSDNNII